MAQEKEDKLKRILWLDLETTGLDHDTLRVLEVGWTVTDLELIQDPTFDHIATMVVRPHNYHPGLMDDFVRDMHTRNGLLEVVAASNNTADDADNLIVRTMREIEKHYNVPIEWALGGTGVATFDKRIIGKWFPGVHSRLAYWTYDIGVVRRFMRDVFGVADNPEFKSDNHRVAGDVALALAEAQWWRGRVFGFSLAIQNWTDTAAMYARNADYWKSRYESVAGPVDDEDVKCPTCGGTAMISEHDPSLVECSDQWHVFSSTMGCNCPACFEGKMHDSDCAVHNAPAFPAGDCNCRLAEKTPV